MSELFGFGQKQQNAEQRNKQQTKGTMADCNNPYMGGEKNENRQKRMFNLFERAGTV